MYLFIFSFFIGSVAASEYEKETTTCPSTKLIRPQRILGGTITPIEEAPYMAALLYEAEIICGGAILSNIFIVTAAHCLVSIYSMEDFTVVIGTSNYRKGGQESNVIYWAMHPDFDMETSECDCAVVRVEPPFTKETPYRELQLPYGNPIVGETLLVSGWGFAGKRKNRSKLKSVDIKVLDIEICLEFYGKLEWTVPKSAFCAGNLEGGRDSCKGDSGGPAVRNGNILIGIISFGYRCGLPGVPGVYTNVYLLTDWIYTKIHNPLWQDYSHLGQ